MDLDQDGLRDVITGSWPGELYWFRGQAGGAFAEAAQLQDARGSNLNQGSASTVFAADWEGDGDLDLLVGNIEGDVLLIRNASGGKALAFGDGESVRVAGKALAVDGDSAPILADWDGDGRRDLLVGSGGGSVIWCRDLAKEGAPLLGPRRELLRPSTLWNDDGAAHPKTAWGVRTKPCVADWDGDGKMDLLVGDFATRDAPTVALSPEQAARRDEFAAALRKCSEEYSERWLEASRRAARELDLPLEDGQPRPPKDRVLLTRWHERSAELIEAEHPGWQQAHMERIAQLQADLQPLQGESSTHGHVWFFRRR